MDKPEQHQDTGGERIYIEHFTTPEAYTTGAFIQPVWLNGKYYWIVDRFEDDTFIDGECISGIQPVAVTLQELTPEEVED